MSWRFLLSSHLLGRPALMPRGCIFLCFLNKTELYHRAVTLVHLLLQVFAVETGVRKLHAPPTSMVLFLGFNLAETTSAWPPQGEIKHSRSPTQRKLPPRWKLDAKKTQLRGSDKKPRMLETGTAKTNLAGMLMRLSLSFQKTSRWGKKSLLLWLERRMANKILIPL